MLSVNVEQRVNVKFCVKLGKCTTETYDMLKYVYGDECLFRTQVFEWFKSFKKRREEIGEDQRPGRPSMYRIGQCKQGRLRMWQSAVLACLSILCQNATRQIMGGGGSQLRGLGKV